ncbi:MAG TPA: HDOD domain-containing protein [Bryobacteraceae bacterium]|nr:HDOD domain-containing protein [Bryobacteraceae bacterium]
MTASASTSAAGTPTVRERSLIALGQLPPFSPILNRLIASLANEDVSFAKIAELIEKDTVLAGNILKLVNSALYGLAGTVNSIRHAVSLLGIAKLRNAALSMSVARMWGQVKTPPGWSTKNFNQHSVGVGILADLLAQRLNVVYAEGAFAAGLFHDLGLMLVAIGLHDEYKQLSLLCQQSKKWDPEYEIQVLGMSHAELSADALAKWNLPQEIQTAVRYHGTPELDPTPADSSQLTLSSVLNAADRYVKSTGIFVTLFESPSEDPQSALEQLGLGDKLPAILNEFNNEFTAIQSYF